MTGPGISYARSGDGWVAYAVSGEGPLDVLYVTDWAVGIEAGNRQPRFVRLVDTFASFARVVRFDRRGTGVSDPLPNDGRGGWVWVDDALAVLDAVGIERVVVFGECEGARLALAIAARAPERVERLVLFHGHAQTFWEPDFPLGHTEATHDAWLDRSTKPAPMLRTSVLAPSASADPKVDEWLRESRARAASPSSSRRLFQAIGSLPVRAHLDEVRAPVLVLHRADQPYFSPELAAHLADELTDATLVTLAGDDHLACLGDTDAVVAAVASFVELPTAGHRRALRTMLFTDIVGSTAQAGSVGADAWRRLLDLHDSAVQDVVTRWAGTVVKQTGDGVLCTFDEPSLAIRAAVTLSDRLTPLDLTIRAGVHASVVDIRDGDLGGIGVHVAQRVAAAAAPGEVVVSSTVAELLYGVGDDRLVDLGEHELKGVRRPWRLYRVMRD